MNWYIRLWRRPVSVLSLLAIVFCVCLLLAWFSKLAHSDIDLFFSSDCLYLPSVYKDLFIDGNSLKGWDLNPAPNFFPDMLLYFVLMALSGHSLIVASFAFSIIQFFVIVFLLVKLLHYLMPGISRHWSSLIIILSAFPVMEYLFATREYYYSFYILSNAYHTGAFVMTLVCLFISLRYFQQPTLARWLALVLLGALCVLSDRLFLVFYTAPAFVATFFLIGFRRPAQLFSFLLTLVLSAAGGLLALQRLSQSEYFHIDAPHKMMAFSDIGASWDIFSEQMLVYLSEFGFRSFFIYFTLISLFGLIVMFFRLRKQGNWLLSYYLVFSTAFCLFVVSAPIINGNYTGYDILRYNIFPVFMVPLNLVLLLVWMFRSYQWRYTKPVALLTYAGLLVLSLSVVDTAQLYRYFHYYPANARLLDTLADKQQLKQGIGNYWDAKASTMFSRRQMRICAVYDDFSYQGHVANRAWFYGQRFNFLWLKNPVDTARCRETFGSFHMVKAGDKYSFVQVPDFTYAPGSNLPVLVKTLDANIESATPAGPRK